MENLIKTIARTKKGNFEVNAEISVNQETDCTSEKMQINLNGVLLQVFLHHKEDRISLSDAAAKWFGVKNDSNVVLLCDTSKIFSEKRRMHQEAKKNRYDGSDINSGFGFMMKNTSKNVILVAKHGFDAIELVN